MARLLARPLGVAAAALTLLAVALPVSAQDGPGGRGAFQIGYQSPDIDALNSALDASALPVFDDGLITIGGFGFFTAGKVIIGGEGHGFLPREEDTPDGTYRTRLTGGYGLFNLGYAAYSSARLDVYPIFGVGGGGMQLDLIERDSPIFSEVLDDPGRSSRLTSDTWLISAAIGADWRLGSRDHAERDRRDRRDRDDDDKGRGGLFVGLRGGWMWAPGDVNWVLDELNDVAAGPGTAPTGFFLRVSIGGGG